MQQSKLCCIELMTAAALVAFICAHQGRPRTVNYRIPPTPEGCWQEGPPPRAVSVAAAHPAIVRAGAAWRSHCSHAVSSACVRRC